MTARTPDFTAEPQAQEVILGHPFSAPWTLVSRVGTDPALIPRWWARPS